MLWKDNLRRRRMRKTRRKAFYGTVGERSYAFRVDGVDGAEFFGLHFVRRIPAFEKLIKFEAETAKHVAYVKGSQKAVREWVREKKPSQFFAWWISETDFYKDDSIKICYTTKEDEEEQN